MKLMSLFLLFISLTVQAGQEGHGGATVVCREPVTHKILSAQLLDLWEGRLAKPMGLGLAIPEIDNLSVDEIVNAKIKKLTVNNPKFGAAVAWEYFVLKSLIFILPAGIANADPHDTPYAFVPEGCSVEYAANYQDSHLGEHMLYINKNISERLSKTDYAALLLHEAIYKVYRMNGSGSLRARFLVAYLFSDKIFPARTIPTDVQTQYSCRGGEYSNTWISKMYETKDSYVFDFESMEGQILSTQKTFTILKTEIGRPTTNMWLYNCDPNDFPNKCIVHPTESLIEGGEKLILSWITEDDVVKGGYRFHISFADKFNPYGASPLTQTTGGYGMRCLPE